MIRDWHRTTKVEATTRWSLTSETGHDLGDNIVQVFVGGNLDLHQVGADVVQSLIL